MKLVLEVLIHRVNQPIAESPEQEQGTDEREGDDQVLAVVHCEKAFFICAHGV
ncbi:MAG: hypothetical protein WCQ21_27860 [Verrucomicrobiota bacterium]